MKEEKMRPTPYYNSLVILSALVSVTMVILVITLQVNFTSIVGANTDQFSTSSYGIALGIFAILTIMFAVVCWSSVSPKGPRTLWRLSLVIVSVLAILGVILVFDLSNLLNSGAASIDAKGQLAGSYGVGLIALSAMYFLVLALTTRSWLCANFPEFTLGRRCLLSGHGFAF